MNIEYRRDGQFPWRRDFSPDQDSIGRIKVQATLLIGLNYRKRVVSEELVEIVQVTVCSRMNIRSVQGAMVNAIKGSDLKFLVDVTSLAR